MKYKWILLFLIILFLFDNLFSQVKNSISGNFIEVVNQNRRYILDKMNDTIFNISHKALGKKLFEKDIPTNVCTDNKVRILGEVFYWGCVVYAKGKYINPGKNIRIHSPFIEDENLYKIIISAFKCKEIEIKRKAYKYLLKYSRKDYLEKYADELREGIFEYRKAYFESCAEQSKRCKELLKKYKVVDGTSEGYELYLRLPILQKEKKKFILNKHIPLYLRALLGDKEAETTLINKFNKEEKYRGKKKLGNQLSIIGSPNCAKAIIRSLYLPLKSSYKQGTVLSESSIRVPLIKALLRMHPEVDFRYDMYYVFNNKTEAYGGKEKEIELFIRILSWAEKAYNVRPEGEAPDTSETIFRKVPPFPLYHGHERF